MKKSQCARCELDRAEMACLVERGKGGAGCVSLSHKDLIEESVDALSGDDLELARAASIQEGEGYADRRARPRPVKPRILETCEFARRMGYERIGLAFCIGLLKEASMVAEIFESWGFEVVSVVCKAGAVPKERIGIKDEEKIRIGTFETMCNPIMQARVLNDASTELNVVIGLCVGHDALFLKHAHAPCTVLAAKDRLTGHNPLAALYTSHSYYSRIRKP